MIPLIPLIIANGEGDQRVENHPALQGMDLPPLGGGGRNPVLVTSTLLIHAHNDGDDTRLLARDKATGAVLASVSLPAAARAAPMTYESNGRQYIVVAVLSEPTPELIAFAFPDGG